MITEEQRKAVEAKRQEIAKGICDFEGKFDYDRLVDQFKERYLMTADAILRLLGGIIDPVQTRPENPYLGGVSFSKEAYEEAQSDMIAAGWKRFISLEEK